MKRISSACSHNKESHQVQHSGVQGPTQRGEQQQLQAKKAPTSWSVLPGSALWTEAVCFTFTGLLWNGLLRRCDHQV